MGGSGEGTAPCGWWHAIVEETTICLGQGGLRESLRGLEGPKLFFMGQ